MKLIEKDKYLLSVKSLKTMLSEDSDECKIDFGDRYIVKLYSNGKDIVTVHWIGKPAQDAIYAAKERGEALGCYKHSNRTKWAK
jgi:hypothetical protein